MSRRDAATHPRTSSIRDRAERVLVLIFVTIRVTGLVQAVGGVVVRATVLSSRPTASLACLGVLTVESIVVGTWMYRLGGVTARWWLVPLDVGTTVTALVVVALLTAPEHRLEPWSMGVYSVSISTALLIGLAVRPLVGALAGSMGLVVAYLSLVMVPAPRWLSDFATAGANAAVYPSYAITAWLVARITRNLADTADTAQRRTAELERERSRATVHDLLPFLRADRFVTADERTRAVMASQAEAKYQQMRAFVDGTEPEADLETHLRSVLDLHPGLTVTATLTAGRGTPPPAQTLEPLLRAVDTSLANVEQHAPTARVEVTAAAEVETIAVTVHDDGPGFDPAEVTLGYGISGILRRQLQDIGGYGTVTSRPGAGTQVRIVVPRR